LTLVDSGGLAAAARYRLGLWWERRGKLNRAEFLVCCDRACDYLQGAWTDPAGKHPNVGLALGGVLLALALPESAGSERWQTVTAFADQLERLPGFAGGLRAEVALACLDFAMARREAERALQTDDRDRTGLYLLALGRSLIGLNQAQEAIAALEQAKALVVPEVDPDLHIRVLAALHGAYTAAKDYRLAFAVKCDRAAVETQYGFRAFMGAGRLRPQRRMGALGEAATEEIAASGRKADIDALVERVKRNDCRLTVVHGPSGVGKSSLIQAGLVPALRKVIHQSRSVVPVVIEHYENWQAELAQKLQATFPQANPPQSPPELGDLGGDDSIATIPKLLAHLRENDRRNLITVLIFDQFEEFFFKDPDTPKRRPFYDFLRESLNAPYVWVFLSLREDYLHYLLECDRLTNLTLINNDILNKNVRYYLGNFSQKRAKAVIRELTGKSPYRLEEGLIDRWVADLAAKWGEVRPIELQVVGAQMVQGEEKVLTLADYEALGERPKEALVERWLTEVVRDCGEENEELAQRVLFALTEEPEKRPVKTKTELAREVRLQGTGLTPEEQEFAVQGDLDFVASVPVESGLAFELPSYNALGYQLIHDYLVLPIRKQFGVRLEKRLEEERRKRALAEQNVQKRNRWLWQGSIIAVSLLSVFVVTASIFAIQAQKSAEQAILSKKKAQASEKRAQYSAEQSNKLAIRAQESEVGAIKSKVQALQAQQKAFRQTENLRKQKNISDTKTIEAQQEKIKADRQRRFALLARNEERTQRRIAEEQKMITEKKTKLIREAQTVLTKVVGENTELIINTLDMQSSSKIRIFPPVFAPNGKSILIRDSNNSTKLWRLDGRLLHNFISTNNESFTSRNNLYGNEAFPSIMAFAPDGQSILTGSRDRTVKLWKLDGQLVQTFSAWQVEDFTGE
jgi:AAA ATPase domain